MERPNVFILSIDSLRFDYFSDTQTQLAELTHGVEYTNAVSTATQTSSSMPALATGAYTDEFEMWGLPESGEPEPLAEVLANQGYASGLWTDNYLFGKEYNYDRGFSGGDLGEPTWKKKLSNAIRDGPASSLFPVAEWAYFNFYKRFLQLSGADENFYRSANSLNSAALDWLSDQTDPTFCWIHYMDTHHPFEPPEEYLERYEFQTSRSRRDLSQLTRRVIKANGSGFSWEDIEDTRTAYKAACDYMGDKVVEFVESLIEQGEYRPEKDILVITADHGECLSPNRYKMMGHVPPAIWEEPVRVPLMISTPEWSRDTIDEQVSLIDVYDVVVESVESQRNANPSQTPPSPDTLATDVAYFVTEWEAPDADKVVTYRGIRRKDGKKLFGARYDGEDRTILADYDVDQMTDDIVFSSDGLESPDDPEIESDWKELRDIAEERGPLIGDKGSLRNELDRDHLRDLGYIDQ